MNAQDAIAYTVCAPISNEELDRLLQTAWRERAFLGYAPIHAHSLGWVCAHRGDQFVGFVNIAWDGGVHAFLLDSTVHPDHQRQGRNSRRVLSKWHADAKMTI